MRRRGALALQIRDVKIGVPKVRSYRWIVTAPSVPRVWTILENLELLCVGHLPLSFTGIC